MSALERITETPSYGHTLFSKGPNRYNGKTVNWVPSDEEWRFEENMADPRKRELLEKFGWTKESITYTFNNYGFRSDEFTDGVHDSIVFLGCSLTMGIGMRLEETWAYRVASSLGLRRYSLGIGGGGPDMCFRLAHHWIPKLRPKYVMMLTPYSARTEIVTENRIFQFLPNWPAKPDDKRKQVFEPYYDAWLSHPANADMNGLKCSLGVRSICENFDAELIEIPLDLLEIKTLMTAEGWNSTVARDLNHPGTDWNRAVSEKFLERI